MTPQKVIWKPHRRRFQIAGIGLEVASDIAFTDATFGPKFNQFAAAGPGADIFIHHHFYLPEIDRTSAATEVYRTPPWRILKSRTEWIYQIIVDRDGSETIYQTAIVSKDHTQIEIYHSEETPFRTGGNHSLTLFPTDQVLLARVLADHKAGYFHAAGIALDGQGFLLAGHSGAGKSTLVNNLSAAAETLCDDRTIVRRCTDQFHIHGTWSHGEVQTVANISVPLKAILFLEQAEVSRIAPLEGKKEAIANLLSVLIKPLVTADWWGKMLRLIEEITREIPCFRMHFRRHDNPAEQLRLIG